MNNKNTGRLAFTECSEIVGISTATAEGKGPAAPTIGIVLVPRGTQAATKFTNVQRTPTFRI